MLFGILLSFITSFMLFVFAPLEIYFSNQSEFFYDVWIMLPPLLALFLIFGAASSIFFVIIDRFKISRIIYGVYAASFFSMYVQGNYMVSKLQHIKGEQLEWNDYKEQRIESIILWSICFVFVFVLYKMKKDDFAKILSYPICFIGMILAVTLITSGITTGGFKVKTIYSNTATSEGLLNLSNNENFLILLLDKVDAREVNALIKETPEYSDAFKDFIFFTNAESGYPYTHHSIPHILTGARYEKQSSFSDYINEAYLSSPLFLNLKDKDYSIGVYETDLPVSSEVAAIFDNQTMCERKISSWLKFDIWQTMMIGYRYAPYDLKRFCYLYTNPFDSLKVIPQGTELYDSDNRFFWDKIHSEEFDIGTGNNFRFIHVAGAHEQFYDDKMNYVGVGSYEDAVKSSLLIAQEYLKAIKNAGVYDNSIIIIMADHGKLDPMQQNPILFIKGFNEHHALYYDDAPISFDDLTTAYERLLDGKKSDELFDWKEGDYRERRLLFQDDDNNPDEIMEEYIQTGHAGDMNTLTKIREF